jgi:DEAD/DEAH box helicase domain-containing protein
LTRALEASGIEKLYRHQAEAIDHARSGQHVVVATPTASGKTLVYNVTYLDLFLANPEARALYLFPLKALAQDQLLTFNRTASFLSGRKPSAAIYDGDTPNPTTQADPRASARRHHDQSRRC